MKNTPATPSTPAGRRQRNPGGKRGASSETSGKAPCDPPAVGIEAVPVMPRIIGRPWKPGESGNPSGLAKDTSAAIIEARRLALSHAPKAISRLAELLDDEDPRVVGMAAVALLDRAGVKPHEGDTGEPAQAATIDVAALRARLVAQAAALAGAPTQALPPPPATPAPQPPSGSDHLPDRQVTDENTKNGATYDAGVRAGVRLEAPATPKEST